MKRSEPEPGGLPKRYRTPRSVRCSTACRITNLPRIAAVPVLDSAWRPAKRERAEATPGGIAATAGRPVTRHPAGPGRRAAADAVTRSAEDQGKAVPASPRDRL